MEGYLGETPINIQTHPHFENWTKKEFALLYISMYGQIDGGHHKQWVLDQVTRILLGTPVTVVEAKWANGQSEFRYTTGEPSAEYLAWVKEQLGEYDADSEEYEYGYDEGVAP